MPVGTITSWTAAVKSSFAAGLAILLAGVPKIIGFLVILIIGWIIASLVAKAVDALLHAIKFDDMSGRAGIARFVRDMGVDTAASGVLALVVKWFIRLIVLVAAFDALGLPAVSTLLNRLLLWIPNLVVAIVVLVVGGLLAGALERIVRGAASESGIGSPNLLGTLASWAVWGFAIIVALNQIGIGSTLVNILFMGFVGALALGAGLAFGLGGRDTAHQSVQGWYFTTRQATPRVQQLATDQTQGNSPSSNAVPITSDGRTNGGMSDLAVERRPRR